MKKRFLSAGVALALTSAMGASCIVSGSTERSRPAGAYAALPAFDGTGCVATYGKAGPLDAIGFYQLLAPGMPFRSTPSGFIYIIN